MSFTWFADKPLRTREQIAREVHTVSLARGLDELATVICLMGISTEVGADDENGDRQWWCPINRKDPTSVAHEHDSESDDGYSSGYLQQQLSGPGVTPAWGWGGLWGDPEGGRKRMTLSTATDMFLAALADDYGRAANNPTLAGQFAQRVQGSAFPDRYADKWDEAWTVLRRALDQNPTTPEVPVSDNRPDFNEINEIGLDNGRHASVRSRPPINFFLHTQQPPGTGLGPAYDSAATDLSAYLRSTTGASAVSYHYTIRQATDGGVTVVDVVDTDLYSWSVLNANVFSINLCFAGSRAEWTRDQWMTQSKAIRVAAYLAVQDAKKYGFSTEVIVPPYGSARQGISDHRYVTECLDIGSHTDVGGPMAAPWTGFPWDYFIQCVNEFTGSAPVVTTPAPVTPVPASDWPKNASDRDLLEYIAEQIGPGLDVWGEDGDLGRNAQGRRRTMRAGQAALLRKAGAL
ncbi:hypothetical protein A5721_22970 [Mycobacterium vulneris]|nr:hypothetical protein A5721_22970 [Mycolicibacterium vulneris]